MFLSYPNIFCANIRHSLRLCVILPTYAGLRVPQTCEYPSYEDVRLESLTCEDVRLESLTYEDVRLQSLTYGKWSTWSHREDVGLQSRHAGENGRLTLLPTAYS